jgi:SnoaL-like protein
MKRASLLFALLLLSAFSVPEAQTPAASKSASIKPEEMANEWFIRLNELDKWYISFDGKEENARVVDRFLELYAPDAFHQVGPSENQSGAVVFHGRDAIRKWADDFSKTFTALNYRIEYKTRKEKPLQPIYAIQFPWGGTGAAAQFEAIYTNRQDRRQFVVPAAVFFIFDEAGKIESLRLYMLRDEAAEIG